MRFNLLTISLLPLLCIITSGTLAATVKCNVIGTNGEPACTDAAGNPINVLTGNKFESANDIQSTTSE
ncbi:hypothetical protein, partial [Psychrobacter sp. K31L]|uniref:hypothetical protein n=1 Tax=Psychrobacter sp. K31L TaxID=2820758 RepID=UPI001B32F100